MVDANADGGAPRAAGKPAGPAAAEPAAKPAAHPPKPRFALTVGVVGHRLRQWASESKGADAPPQFRIELLQRVASDIQVALGAIKTAATLAYHNHAALFDDSPDAKRRAPELTLVSALADGADTIAAKAALDLGYALDAPLPFARTEYENDFSTATIDENRPAPRQEFHALLRQARSVLELPGQRETTADTKEQGRLRENRAYEAVGLTVLSQADILLAVWDRGLSRGRGGTAEMVAEAARAGIPIVVVDANGEKPIELRWRGLKPTPAPIVAFDDLPRAELGVSVQHAIDELVRPPRAAEQRAGLEHWFREQFRGVNIRFGFPLLMAFSFVRRMRCTDFFPSQPSKLATSDYVEVAAPVLDATKPGEIAWLAEPYGWADAIAVYCAQLFRSAFVMNFFFAAVAVVVA